MNIANCQLPIAGDNCRALSECARPRAQGRPFWQDRSNFESVAGGQHFCARGRAHSNARRAFTLIEMLVVIAIIGILAALIVGATSRAGGAKVRSRVQTEAAGLVTVIGQYYQAHGYYPQDNRNNSALSPLYHELTQKQIPDAFTNDFGVNGIANLGAKAQNFHKNLKPSGYMLYKKNGPDESYLLAVPYKGPNPIAGAGGEINPWHYNSSKPVHNPDSFDLWAEVVVGGKTNIIANWKE